MDDELMDVEDAHSPVERGRGGQRRAAKPRHLRGCLAGLLALVVVVVAASLLVVAGLDKVKALLSGPEDYAGNGQGAVVLFEVRAGETAGAIGRNLHAVGIVKSVEAFTDAAAAEPKSRGIQVGFYELRPKMSADSALAVLVDPANLVRASVTIPEGLTVEQTVAALAKQTDFRAAKFVAALKHPDRLGLPAYAEGNPEGYLFPATYQVPPDATAASILKQMVDRFHEAAKSVGLEGKAPGVGMRPQDVVTVASIIEREVRRETDLAGVAEVVYNRLDGGCPETAQLLQMDSTVHFAAGANDSVFTTDEMRAVDSPYNTYKYPGLPPGPIAAPGEAALEAALNPSDKGYCYFVAVNLETGETLFAETQSGHLSNVAKLDEYCAGSDLC